MKILLLISGVKWWYLSKAVTYSACLDSAVRKAFGIQPSVPQPRWMGITVSVPLTEVFSSCLSEGLSRNPRIPTTEHCSLWSLTESRIRTQWVCSWWEEALRTPAGGDRLPWGRLLPRGPQPPGLWTFWVKKEPPKGRGGWLSCNSFDTWNLLGFSFKAVLCKCLFSPSALCNASAWWHCYNNNFSSVTQASGDSLIYLSSWR